MAHKGVVQPTSVVLSPRAQKIKDQLAPIYNFRKLVSAGLILLGELYERDPQEATRIIVQAMEPMPTEQPDADHSDDPCPCDDPDCSRPVNHALSA